MTAKQSVLVLLLISALQAKRLAAQEYLDLWRNGKTDNFYLIQKKFNEYHANRDTAREHDDDEHTKFKRWEYFMEPRVYPSGKLINPAGLALDEEVRYRSSTKSLSAAHNGNWQSLGIKSYTDPRNIGAGMGRVNCITAHPTDPQTLFVGTPSGGLWKTTDGGKSWIPLSDGISVIGVSGIAINPQYPDSIYILTGDGDGNTMSAGSLRPYSIGVLLSINGGDTWQSTGLQWNVSGPVFGYKLLMHPTNSKILFAVTNQGIYKTIDGGINWSLTQEGFFTDLAFKPNDPSTIYAAAKDEFYISINAGESWMKTWPSGLFHPGRIAIGVTPANPEFVYIVAGALGFSGVYRSEDDGKTFNLRADKPNIMGWYVNPPSGHMCQCFYDMAIAVSPINAEEVYVGGVNCWKSIDGGTNWQYASYWQPGEEGGYVHADIHALIFNGNTLYCGNDGGVSYTNDHAANWHDISSGLDITQYYGIAAPANDLGIVYGGAQDNGVNKWTTPANMIKQIGEDGMKCVVDYTNQDIVYAFTFNPGLYVTLDGGKTGWGYNVETGPIGGQWVKPLIMHPTDHTILYAGYNSVWKITDLGKTFTPLIPVFGSPFEGLIDLGMSVSNPAYMYIAVNIEDDAPNSLKLSVNINASSPDWTDITGTLPVSTAQITSVAVSALDANKAWVSFSGYSKGTKVYQTSNAGKTWINISGTLPNVPVNCIVYSNNGTGGIYIGTDIGVFYRGNTMGDWIPFRNGLPNVIVTDLKITNNRIRAATYGRGIWESDLYGSCIPDYTLSGDVTGYQYYEASDAISSTANIKGGIGTQVQYKALNKITLNTGFRVVPESGFVASTGYCSNMKTYQRQYRGVYEGTMKGVLGRASITDSTSLLTDRLKVFPNNFSAQSMIEFYIAKQEKVSINLLDASGKKVKKILFESPDQPAGNYQLRLDATGFRRGKYLIRLKTKDHEESEMITVTN